MQLTKNSAKCKHCGETLTSRHVHDFVTCGCGNVSVDGGLDYAKRSWPGGDPEYWFDELSEYVDEGGLGRKPGVEKARSVLAEALDEEKKCLREGEEALHTPDSSWLSAWEISFRERKEEEKELDKADPRRVQVRKAIEATMSINTVNSPHLYDLQQVALCALRAIRL